MAQPRHVAVIMDGNGRWAQSRRHNRFWGHIRGAKAAKNIIEHAAQNNLECLSLFAFSKENWARPAQEVNLLMKLLVKQLYKETKTLMENNIRFYCIGEKEILPQAVQVAINKTEMATRANTGKKLIFAISYSGQTDLINATKKVAEKVKTGELQPQDINNEVIASHLMTADFPNPDLIIRTSGEERISNFYLWQAAYSELYFTNTLWPDFTPDDFDQALSSFSNKERRFGQTSEQIVKTIQTKKHRIVLNH